MFFASLTFRSSEDNAWVSNFSEVKFMWNFCTTYINRASYGREEHLELYTRSIITLCIMTFSSWRFNVCRAAAEHMKLFLMLDVISPRGLCRVAVRSQSPTGVCQLWWIINNKPRGSDCCCLLFVACSRWFNNVRKGAVNLGAMHFTSSSCFN